MIDVDSLQAALGDSYAVIEEIGRGGMAVVYRAHDLRHDRDVAIKVLRPELAVAVGAERFLREIKIEAQLQHPHILTLHDSGHFGEILYYVMPLIEGESLRDRLSREQQLSFDDATKIACEVAEGLGYAHSKGIVHRDVKPENILLTSEHAILADFGIAQAVSNTDAEQLTGSGVALGTPMYMSPEQATGTDRVDGRSDIYSLGCVLFEMLTGEPPFTGRTAQAVIARHVQERVPSIEVVRPGIPFRLVNVVERSLAKTPADRFTGADEFISALLSSPEEEPEPRGFARLIRTWAFRIAATAIMVVAGITGWFGLQAPSLSISANKVAVFPIAESGLPIAESGVGLGVTYLIEAALDRAAPLKFIDVAPWLDERQLANPERITADAARRIALDRGAAYHLGGVVQGHGDSTTVILRLGDVLADTLIDQTSATGLSGRDPLHHLGIDAVKALLPKLIDPGRDVDLAPLRDRQVDAVALWFQGESQYRNSRFGAALDFYRRSFEADSALVLSAVKGAQAASWVHRSQEADDLVRVAVEHDTLLPSRYASFARGLNGFLSGNADSAIFWYRETLAEDPEWAEASVALGEVYYHLLPSSGPLDSLAETRFTVALNHDSTFAPALFHLTEMAIRRGDDSRANLLLERYRRAGPDPLLVRQLELMAGCVQGGRVDWPDAATRSPRAAARAGMSLSVGGGQHVCAEEAFRAVLRSDSTSAGERFGALLGIQGLLIATGRNTQALTLLDSLIASGNGLAQSLYVLYTLAGAPMDSGAQELEAFAQRVFGQNYERLPGTESHWVLGVWHAYLGEAEKVAVLERALDERANRTGFARDRMYADALAAHSALLRNDTTEAIDRMRALKSSAPLGDVAWKHGAALPVERLLLAELLLAQGRYRESYEAARVFDHPGPMMFLAFLPQSLSVRYRAATAMGNSDLAALSRDRLLSLGREDLIR